MSAEFPIGFTAVCEFMTFEPTAQHFRDFLENEKIPDHAEITLQSNGAGYYIEAEWNE